MPFVCRHQKLATVQVLPKAGPVRGVLQYHHGLGAYAMYNEACVLPALGMLTAHAASAFDQ